MLNSILLLIIYFVVLPYLGDEAIRAMKQNSSQPVRKTAGTEVKEYQAPF